MALTKFTGAINKVSSMSDKPSQDGLTPAQVKQRFEDIPEEIVTYLNDTLTAELDALIGGLLETANASINKGLKDCSTNPNYPAADQGDYYIVSVAGKIGGASGTAVNNGDFLVCNVDDTISGTQAAVGANWTILPGLVSMATILASLASSDEGKGTALVAYANAGFAGTTLKTVLDNFISAYSSMSTDYTNFKTANTLTTKKVLRDITDIDCSSNPAYPAGTAGIVKNVSVAGRIGGATGESVRVKDFIVCIADTAGADATKWLVIHHDSNKKLSDLDCSANPSFPAAKVGDWINITVAGKIGGAGGRTVNAGDMVLCRTDNAGGTSAPIANCFIVLPGITSMALKANQSALDAYISSNDTALGLKAGQTTLDAYIASNDTAVGLKADQADLETLTTEVGTKASQTDLDTLTGTVGDLSTEVDGISSSLGTLTGTVNTKVDVLEAFSVVTHSSYTHTFSLLSVRNFQTTLEDATARTFALSNVPSASGKLIQFSIEVIATAVPAVTYFSGITWKDGIAPIYTASKKYILFFVSYDGGTTYLGSWGEY